MTYGRPGSPGLQSARWTRERLLGLGLTDEQLLFFALRPPARLGRADLEPACFLPEFAPLVQRVQRLVGGGRGLSLYVTGGRQDTAARQHVAVQLALGLGPLGREVVLVDADFLRPGLGGLVDEPLADGIIDMVRFGRSTRSLLLQPIPGGPWLLPAGSFPAEDPVPVPADALQGVVYRVSQVCDVALYVGPLAIRNEVHPLSRACDHVVVAAQEDEPEGGPVLLDLVSQLREQGAHLAAIVLYAVETEVQPEAPGPPAALLPPAPEYLPGAAALPAFPPGSLYPAAPEGLPPVRPEPPGRPETPPLPPLPAMQPEPRFIPPPEPELARPEPARAEPTPSFDWSRLGREAPAWGAEQDTQPFHDVTPGPADEPRVEPPRLDLPPARPDEDAERERRELASAVAMRRPRDEARDVGRDLDLATAEFAFEAEAHDSRWPVLLVLGLVLVIVGFVSWALWNQRRAPHGKPPAVAVVPAPESTPPAPATTTEPPPAPTTTRPAPPEPTAVKPPAATPTTGPGSGAPVLDDRAAEPKPEPPAPARTNPPVEPSTGTGGAPPAPPASVAPPVTPPAAGTVYAVHVASYKTLEQANRDIATLAKLGFEGRPVRTDLGSKGIWYRVYVGSCASVDEANRLRDEILKFPDYTFAQVRRLPRE